MLNKKNILVFILMICTILLYYFTGLGCPILFFTGIPCLGCGMTRACVSLIHFDFVNAFHYHPLCFFLPFILPVIVMNEKLSKKVYQRFLMGFVSIFIVVYLIRLFNPLDTIIKINISQGFLYRLFNRLFF